jgi:hypothetical protein
MWQQKKDLRTFFKKGEEMFNKIFSFDFKSSMWGEYYPLTRKAHIGFIHEDSLFVYGFNNKKLLNDFWVYDLVNKNN